MFLKKIFLEYNYSYFTDKNHEEAGKHSCTTHQENDNPELYGSMGGIPKSYNLHNTIIYQMWYDNEKLKKDLGKMLGIDVVSISSIMQPCGNTITVHADHFYKIKTSYPNDKRKKVRANIFLKDWEPGHILQYKYDNKWVSPSHWKAGDGYIWDSDVLHLSGNSGMIPKFTLQVSGFFMHDN